MKEGRVGIFFVDPTLDSVPSLCSLISLLAREGHTMDVFTITAADFLPPTFEEANVNVHVLKLDSLVRSFRGRFEHLLQLGAAGNVAQNSAGTATVGQRAMCVAVDLLMSLLDGIAFLTIVRLHLARRFVFFIGVEPVGLIRADRHSRVLGIPLIYHSLELLLSGETRTLVEKRLKARESASSRRAAFILIQDDARARLLAADNGLPLDKFLTMPNAPVGPAGRTRQRWWHEKFQLPPETRVLLYAGGIWPGTMLHEIVDAASTLPPNWVLVVHTRSNTENSALVQQCRRTAAPGKVYFSPNSVRRQVYDCLVASANIGIAFYAPVEGAALLGSNLSTIGLSSGKIAYFLRAGLPVIVNDATSVAAFVRDNECGAVVQSAAEIPDAIARIVDNYDRVSQRACEAFTSQLDGAGTGRVILHALKQVEREHGLHEPVP